MLLITFIIHTKIPRLNTWKTRDKVNAMKV